MPITMEGKYAYASDPYTEVRILCVDRNNQYAPVLSLDWEGSVHCHRADGFKYPLSNSGYNLVPLKKKPVQRWAVETPKGFITTTCSKQSAERTASEYENSRVFLMREVEE